jgi:hypothetical protein
LLQRFAPLLLPGRLTFMRPAPFLAFLLLVACLQKQHRLSDTGDSSIWKPTPTPPSLDLDCSTWPVKEDTTTAIGRSTPIDSTWTNLGLDQSARTPCASAASRTFSNPPVTLTHPSATDSRPGTPERLREARVVPLPAENPLRSYVPFSSFIPGHPSRIGTSRSGTRAACGGHRRSAAGPALPRPSSRPVPGHDRRVHGRRTLDLPRFPRAHPAHAPRAFSLASPRYFPGRTATPRFAVHP